MEYKKHTDRNQHNMDVKKHAQNANKQKREKIGSMAMNLETARNNNRMKIYILYIQTHTITAVITFM